MLFRSAIRRIEESSGVQFDPHMARAFIRYVKEKGSDLAAPVPSILSGV